MVKTGLDLLSNHLTAFKDKRIGLIINQASVNSDRQSTLDIFRFHNLNVSTLFGPQHGLYGHTQDNMIEWHGDEYGVPEFKIFSLYGTSRKPTHEMLADVDVLVFDVQDVGARYYTFIWTMALCMEAAQENGKAFVVLDRPNPLGGEQVEGPLLDMNFRSFVGLYPIPVRHGLTTGEISLWLKNRYFPDLQLKVIEMTGWERKMYFSDTGLPWVMPSPNMPSPDTAVVYPGQCLLEATNVSEGRGTARPFEIFGAPWIDNEKLCTFLTTNCHGAIFQPWYFEPTFNMYAGELCRGAFIHVIDNKIFRPLTTTLIILSYLIKEYLSQFRFNDPPYEYEYEKLPFDILMGNSKWRSELEVGHSYEEWQELWKTDLENWQAECTKVLLY